MAFDAPAVAVGDLKLCERRQESSGGPAFLVRLPGELGPNLLDGGQAQFGQEKFDARRVDGGGVIGHAAASKAPG